MLKYFPPFRRFAEAMGLDSKAFATSPAKKDRVIKAFITNNLKELEVNLDGYIAANTDLAKANFSRKALLEHFLENGYFEGRAGYLTFDEGYYLRRYPDVAAAVKKGATLSAIQHFRDIGMYEMRCPNAAAEAEVTYWAQVLH